MVKTFLKIDASTNAEPSVPFLSLVMSIAVWRDGIRRLERLPGNEMQSLLVWGLRRKGKLKAPGRALVARPGDAPRMVLHQELVYSSSRGRSYLEKNLLSVIHGWNIVCQWA